MSEALERRAELLKLARLWECEPDELGYLGDDLDATELAELRELSTERLFSANAALFGAVGVATRLVPSGLAATIAERVFGPLLCARAAGNADPAKAIDIARRLPGGFLADVSVQLDPRRVAHTLSEVPLELTVEVARRLAQRAEYVTMGRFLGFLPDRSVLAAIDVLSDEALLRTAFVLEHKDRLDQAIGLLAPERLEGLIRCASELGLWPEALDLLDHLSDARRAPIAELYARQPSEVIAGLIATVNDEDLWDALLPIVALMSHDARARLARLEAFHDPAVLSVIVNAAADPESGLWRDLGPLIAELPAEVRLSAARIIADLAQERPEALATIVQVSVQDGSWRTFLPLLELLNDHTADDIAPLAAEILPAIEPLPAELVPVLEELRARGLLG